jgi:hypothetical protein
MRSLTILLLSLGFTTFPAASADEYTLDASRPATQAQETSTPQAFAAGSFSLQSYCAYLHDLSNRDVRVAGGTIGAGYYIFDSVGLNLELSGSHIDEPGPDTCAWGVGLLLRHHLIRRQDWSFFLDVGPGVAEAGREVPPGGTDFNITFRSGPGITFELRDGLHLITGVRYCHWSNADMHGRDRNPSINGVEGYVGVMFTF